MKPPASRGTMKRGGMHRSASMANLSSGAQKEKARGTLAQSKMRSSTLNLTGRPSNVSSSVLANRVPAGSNGRRPGANITNQIHAKAPSKEEGDGKGKGKRPGWDLKGRLQDMEALVKSNIMEKKEMESRLKEYDSRIENLESEKNCLNIDLQKTTTVYQNNQQDIDRLNKELRDEQNSRSMEKQNFEQVIENLNLSKSSLERQIKSLNSEVEIAQSSITGLTSTVNQLTTARVGMEAQLKTTELLLSDRNKKVSEMEELIAQQMERIAEMEQKIQEDEVTRRKLHNTVLELKGNIRVFCRVRPLLGDEVKHNGDSDVIHHINFLDERSLEVGKGDANSSSMSGLRGRGNNFFEFSYDRVFNPSATQAEVFEEVSQLSQSALDGYNVCVFAYGQTGSGKTFTMEGIHGDGSLEGMIPRTVKHIFKSIKDLEGKGWSYKVEASFLEIYNESIRDLLAPQSEAKNLTYEIRLQENKKNETYVTNLKIIPVENESKVHTLLNMAQQQRAVAATHMNERSSRSHSVFRLKLIGTNSKTSEACEGTLNLVDLAGSERLKESKSEGARLTETQNINKSLAELGNVIMALGQKQNFIPYRNSKLTHLLQNSLGGNSKTLMVVNVSPLDACLNETLNSLRFATKVNQCHIGTATKQVKK